MRNLAIFLTRLQTFNLRIITKSELKSPIKEEGEKQAYSIAHETHYYDSFTYQSEIRVLKDMALIDLLSLNDISLKREFEQLKKLKDRFKLIWANFHEHYNEFKDEYPRNFIFSIQLQYLFIVNNLQSDYKDIYIGDEFVESLHDTLKIRDKFLNELVSEVDEILNPRETFEEWIAKQKSPKQVEDATPELPPKIPYNPDAGRPKFNHQYIDDFLQLIRTYFSEEHFSQLDALIKADEQPASQLIFNGNSNKLADAFKQLYEANLIVGCNKAELEKWILKHFLYSNGDKVNEYSEGWLSAIISSDTKVCKSPILEVRMKDKVPFLVPTVRNKKNSKY
ncbi:hypothetical protein SAMN04488511_101160 [Pedobacter suwonensis]|uniref:Uncharacterized protein n=1 Tax=Pedobacter suwonensis TaxID=332999 RepID=A0A1I0SHP1_9SPHI|nr:hypothetical protein [Pedobacter suwonensis]SFA38266.1 hypothetical protein SAMN04488511_101160 [Pedobacter suwonensis]